MKNNFSITSYTEMLKLGLSKGYEFIPFSEKNQNRQFCILRHDIDADLNAAVQMARAEKVLDIKSTYFLMLRSPVYNIFSRSNHRYVEEIIALGHCIGLHYDEGFYPSSALDLQELVAKEASVMNSMFGVDINVVSFHQPGDTILKQGVKLENYLNTYDSEQFTGIKYISDSNMAWKSETPWEVFSEIKFKKVQLLIHPMWWVSDGTESTELLWNKAIIENSKRSLDQIIQTERAFGKPRFLKFTNE